MTNPEWRKLLEDPAVRETLVARLRFVKNYLNYSCTRIKAKLNLGISSKTLHRYLATSELPVTDDLWRFVQALYGDEPGSAMRRLLEDHQARTRHGTLRCSEAAAEMFFPRPARVRQLGSKQIWNSACTASHILWEARSLPSWMFPRKVYIHLVRRVMRHSDMELTPEQQKGLLAVDAMWRSTFFERKKEGAPVAPKIVVIACATGVRRLMQKRWPFAFLSESELSDTLDYLEGDVLPKGVRLHILKQSFFIQPMFHALESPQSLHGCLGTIAAFDDNMIVHNVRVDTLFGIARKNDAGLYQPLWRGWFRQRTPVFERAIESRCDPIETPMNKLRAWFDEGVAYRANRLAAPSTTA
ncbi:MAG: hypothetical protein KatS3mg104_1816 [Phycisphaerae bacterium]|nr:MAG: hypothetical protein KatS3mg104_1816 [Phycisphaerae bacterium]